MAVLGQITDKPNRPQGYPLTTEEPEATSSAEQEQEQEQPEEINEPSPKDEPSPEEAEPEPKPKPISKSKRVLDMPTTSKISEQVKCKACGRKMSAKNLKYCHAKYCTERNQEQQPEEIPAPQIEVKNNARIKDQKSQPAKPQGQPFLKRAATTAKRDAEEQEHEEHQEIPKAPEQMGEQRKPEDWRNNNLSNSREEQLASYKSLFSNAC